MLVKFVEWLAVSNVSFTHVSELHKLCLICCTYSNENLRRSNKMTTGEPSSPYTCVRIQAVHRNY